MLIKINEYGYIVIIDSGDDYWIKRTYIGHSKKEATKLFKGYLKERKEQLKRLYN